VLDSLIELKYFDEEKGLHRRGILDVFTLLVVVCAVETIRSISDWCIFKIQRKVNLSNLKKEKLSQILTLLFFSFIACPVLLGDIQWNMFLLPSEALRASTKSYYLIQMAFWFSCSIRSLEEFLTHRGGPKSDTLSKTSIMYLICVAITYHSRYGEAGQLLFAFQYVTEFLYQSYRLLWVFGSEAWSGLFLNRVFQVWSLLFITCRATVITWCVKHFEVILLPVVFIQVYLIWCIIAWVRTPDTN